MFRKWRRTAAFKQKDITYLLGIKNRAHVSKLENGSRNPGLALAISLEVLTGHPLCDLFSELYETIEEETLARVTAMLEAMEGHESGRAAAKRKHLKACQDRVITRHKQQEMHA